jgi:excisionase family DNA binding protein
MEPIEKVYIGVKEMTQMLPVSKAQIYSLVRNNKLKHYRFGKKILFKKDEILNQITQDNEDKSKTNHRND